jgi:hypothetical protein
MNRIIFCTMLLAALPLAALAGEGHGTIRETDTAIIVEYYGNAEDAKAARIVKERDEKQSTVDEERRKVIVEKSIEKDKAKAAIRALQGPRVREEE